MGDIATIKNEIQDMKEYFASSLAPAHTLDETKQAMTVSLVARMRGTRTPVTPREAIELNNAIEGMDCLNPAQISSLAEALSELLVASTQSNMPTSGRLLPQRFYFPRIVFHTIDVDRLGEPVHCCCQEDRGCDRSLQAIRVNASVGSVLEVFDCHCLAREWC